MERTLSVKALVTLLGVLSASASATGLFPLIEYVNTTSLRDVAYLPLAGGYGTYNFFPTGSLGLVLPADAAGGTVKLYRCLGTKTNGVAGWGYSFYATDPACPGHDFSKLSSATAVASLYATATSDAGGKKLIPVYRYWIKGTTYHTPVLSTTAPDAALLTILRYQTDPVLGSKPLGYIVDQDASLDGHQRWMMTIAQSLCYGLGAYATTCPALTGSLKWRLLNPSTGAEIVTRQTTGTGQVSFTASELTALISSGKAIASRPLVLLVERDGQVIAGKNVRILRVPFVSQYDNTLEKDDFGDSGSFPTTASALLMANQMTANTSYTDPLAMRAKDPALFDMIMSMMYFSPHTLAPGVSAATIDAKQKHGFQALDDAGVLLGVEAAYTVYTMGSKVFPFNSAEARELGTDSAHDKYWAESFSPFTGLFLKTSMPYAGSYYSLDLANPDALAWLTSGVKSFLDRLHALGIAPAAFSLSEVAFQGGAAAVPTNQTRLPYYESPTFSESSFTSFRAWLRAAGAPSSYVALPVLPKDYAVALAKGNPYLYRIQPAVEGSALWTYWTVWRRAIFNNMLAKLALKLKEQDATLAYRRSPLQVVVYNYVDWTAFSGVKYDMTTKTYWPFGYLWSGGQLYVDQGNDFDYVRTFAGGAVDYLVYEAKFLSDAETQREARRMLASRTASPASRIGLHVDMEYPTVGTNFMSTHMGEIFNGGYKSSAFDMVWNWEAQCEYVLSMKAQDAGNEKLYVSTDTAGTQYVSGLGTYATIYSQYSSVIGKYCLLRHKIYNLANSGKGDTRPMWVLRENVRRLLAWRQAYLEGQ